MGGCETHSADLRTHPASPTHPRPRPPATSRLFPAPHHRPPLARIKLVCPRPRPGGRYRCGRSSLTRGRAAAHTGSCEESQQKVAPASPATTARPPGQPTTPSWQEVPPWVGILRGPSWCMQRSEHGLATRAAGDLGRWAAARYRSARDRRRHHGGGHGEIPSRSSPTPPKASRAW